MALAGAFPEPLAASLADWPHGYARQPILDETWHPEFDTKKFLTQPHNPHIHPGWMKQNFTKFKDIDDLYDYILEKNKQKHLFLRWNQCVCWINKWSERPDHKWVTLIRNPMARACSAYKKWGPGNGWSYEQSLKSTIRFTSHQESIKHKMLIVYYEDLVANQKAELQRIFDYLDISVSKFSKLDLYSTSINKYKSDMAKKMIELYAKELRDIPLLKRYF
jgi:hypothetical protein